MWYHRNWTGLLNLIEGVYVIGNIELNGVLSFTSGGGLGGLAMYCLNSVCSQRSQSASAVTHDNIIDIPGRLERTLRESLKFFLKMDTTYMYNKT